MNLNVKCSNEVKISVSVEASDTVKRLKELIEEKLKDTSIPTPVSSMRLIYSGRVMKDEEALAIYKIADGHTYLILPLQ